MAQGHCSQILSSAFVAVSAAVSAAVILLFDSIVETARGVPHYMGQIPAHVQNVLLDSHVNTGGPHTIQCPINDSTSLYLVS